MNLIIKGINQPLRILILLIAAVFLINNLLALIQTIVYPYEDYHLCRLSCLQNHGLNKCYRNGRQDNKLYQNLLAPSP